jgi:predicted small secreted protein
MKKTVITIMLAVYAVVFVTGCRHTAEGAGKDIERTGEKIQDKAK